MIHHVDGDVTCASLEPPWFLVHVCNDVGKWGAGVSGAISRRWPEPEAMFRRTASLRLGTVQFVRVAPRCHVVNCVAQRGVGRGVQRVDYDALRTCLRVVAPIAQDNHATIIMPRIGCGLGGGSWATVSAIIDETLAACAVLVFSLPSPRRRFVP